MSEQNPEDAVRKEQFGSGDSGSETTGDDQKEKDTGQQPAQEEQTGQELKNKKDGVSDTPVHDKEEQEDGSGTAPQPEAAGEEEEEPEQEEKPEKEAEDGSKEEPEQEEKPEKEAEAGSIEEPKQLKDQPPPEELPPVDYSGFTRRELLETLNILIEDRPVHEIHQDVERIRKSFQKRTKSEQEKQKEAFVQDGGKPEEFNYQEDDHDIRLKDLLKRFRRKKTEQARDFEFKKQENLRKKYEIIEKLKELVHREESINKTFQEFRELQNEWRAIGLVPQHALKDLWENYHHHVEIFYDYIKINKELRDLDLKKNQEEKVKLCEKAEALLLEPNTVSAFRTLQTYHDRWRETGPVPRDKKEELWERFREATSVINKRHHEFFQKQKEEQKKNLEAKTALCEKVEEISSQDIQGFKGWEKNAREVIEIQKLWRTIGFAPKKHNSKIYKRFRESCDAFFQRKRAFYAANKELQQNNMQKKTDLCMQAEALQDSTEWKETAEELKKLQREWKGIGPVPRKHSDKIWKRFRAACDRFFDRKKEHFSSMDSNFAENLKAKEELIREIQEYTMPSDMEEAFEKLKEYQNRWAEIGFVPYEKKDQVANDYRNALNQKFDNLKVDEDKKNILKYKNKLESLQVNPKANRKLRTDREKFINKIKQLEGDVVLWENNIGFFAKSENADSLIQEVQQKIDNARTTITTLEEKIRLIDESEMDS